MGNTNSSSCKTEPVLRRNHRVSFSDKKVNNSALYSELISLQFDEVICLAAVEKYPNDFKKAIEYALNLDDKNDEISNIKCYPLSTPQRHSLSIQSSKSHIYDTNIEEVKVDTNIKSQIYANENICTSYSDCSYIQRIVSLLKLYVNSYRLQFISDIISKYDITSILNDYHHIIDIHGNDNDLEQLSYSIICKFETCQSSTRNGRNRINSNNNNIYKVHEQVLIDIFDSMHCHLLHSFDISYRLTQKEKKKISENDKLNFNKASNIINTKRIHQQRKTYNKFQTKINDKKEQHLSVYSFGVNFNYWNDENPLYVTPKYSTFKQEITSNIICLIPIKEWNECNEKSVKFMKTKYAKSLKNHISTPFKSKQKTRGYHLKRFQAISISHLMSIIFYTDFSVLSYKLTETFRKCKANETINEIMERNSNLCLLSKLIKETVNCYGQRNRNNKWEYYFHGISTEMIFNSTTAAFNHPTSTTKQLSVAHIFSGNDGIIINLMKRQDFYCFDCFWISSFSNEDETLFTSGQIKMVLIITNIINCSNYKQYKAYIHCINQLIMRTDDQMLGNNSPYIHPNTATSTDIRILKQLLNGDSLLLIPTYLLQIFKMYQMSTKIINIETSQICTRAESVYFLNLLLSENRLFVNLENIIKIYPNIQQIILRGNHWNSAYPDFPRIKLSESYLNFVALQLKQYAPLSLSKIIIEQIEFDHKDIVDLLQSKREQFEQQTKFTLEWNKNNATFYIKRLDISY